MGGAAWAAAQGVRGIAVRGQTAYREAYQALIKSECRVRWSDLRMTLAGYPEPVPARDLDAEAALTDAERALAEALAAARP